MNPRGTVHMMAAASAVLLVSLLSACDGMGHGLHAGLGPGEATMEPPPAPGSLVLPALIDSNPDPAVVEVDVRAMVASVEYLPGRSVHAWTYNGRVPGPVLRANVGDQVVVHFRNDLPEPTTIHWHGVRVPNSMDGVALVMDPVPPGGSFTYRFQVPDAGTFWFHPHVRSDVQVERGLYAPIVVDDPGAVTLPAVSDEVIVLDDILLDPLSGQLREAIGPRHEMMGREGNLVLVNGRPSNLVVPEAGGARRWRLVNAANARFFRLALRGGRMVQVAGDGGLLETPREVSDLLLVPGERAEIVVWSDVPGPAPALTALPYQRARGAGATTSVDLVRLGADSVDGSTAPVMPSRLRPALPALAGASRTRQFRLGEIMGHGGMRFTINGRAYPGVPTTESSAGSVEAWELVNDADMDHPMHLHGFFFRPAGHSERKDTINVPARRTVRVLVDLDARAGAMGRWMYHCHILEHAERGMMGEVEVGAGAR